MWWIEWVNTKANPADAPARIVLTHPEKYSVIRFPAWASERSNLTPVQRYMNDRI